MSAKWVVINCTPHEVTLSWLEDNLDIWKKAGWGWGMWNSRGPFGILDSNRKDVKYENFRGHKLDRKMLRLLQQYYLLMAKELGMNTWIYWNWHISRH